MLVKKFGTKSGNIFTENEGDSKALVSAFRNVNTKETLMQS